MAAIDPDDVDNVVTRIDQGESAWLDSDQAVPVDVKRPLDKVVPVRLSADHWRAVYRAARERGVGPTTLVRMWVLEKLREESKTQVA